MKTPRATVSRPPLSSSCNMHHVVAAQAEFPMEFRSEANRSVGKRLSKGASGRPPVVERSWSWLAVLFVNKPRLPKAGLNKHSIRGAGVHIPRHPRHSTTPASASGPQPGQIESRTLGHQAAMPRQVTYRAEVAFCPGRLHGSLCCCEKGPLGGKAHNSLFGPE